MADKVEKVDKTEKVTEKVPEKATEKPEKVEKEKTKKEKPAVIKDGLIKIVSKKRAGKSIVAVTGKVITFDKDGCAAVDAKDAEYLLLSSDFIKGE